MFSALSPRMLRKWSLLSLTLSCFATAANASTVTLPTAGADGPLAGIIAGFQSIVSMFSGPIVSVIMTLGLMGTIIAWFFMPKENILAPMMKFVVGGIILMNIPGWITWLQSMAS